MISSTIIRIFVYVTLMENAWVASSADQHCPSNDSKSADVAKRLTPGERPLPPNVGCRSCPYGNSACRPKPSRPSPPCQPEEHSPVHNVKTKGCGCRGALGPREPGEGPHRCMGLCEYSGCDASCGRPGPRPLMKSQSSKSNHQSHSVPRRRRKERSSLSFNYFPKEDESGAPKHPSTAHSGFISLADWADRVKLNSVPTNQS